MEEETQRQNALDADSESKSYLKCVGKRALLILHFLGAVYLGFFTITVLFTLVMAIIDMRMEDISYYDFFWILAFACSLLIVLSYVLVGRRKCHARAAEITVLLVFAVSLGWLIVGITTNNRFRRDETNVGLYCISHSIFLWILVRISVWKKSPRKNQERPKNAKNA